MGSLAFYFFAGLMCLTAVLVILNRYPVYALLYLLVSMMCVASLFVLLGAYFLAMLQILVYAGAILVLFLFVIMLLNVDAASYKKARSHRRLFAGSVVAGAFVFALSVVIKLGKGAPTPFLPASPDALHRLSEALFGPYLLPFELTSLLLLAAIVGAVVLAKRKLP